MKKLLLVAFVVLVAANTNAQLKLGIKAGLNVANMEFTGATDVKSLTGFHGGLILDASLGPIALQPGVLFSQKGLKQSSGDGKFALNYIDIPVNVMYKIGLPGIKILLMAGPELSYGLSAKMSGGGSPTTTFEFGSGTDQLKRIDIGAGFGAGVQVSKIQATMNYTLGLTNLSNVSGETIKNKVFSVSLAFLF